jgi:hypothetical protein
MVYISKLVKKALYKPWPQLSIAEHDMRASATPTRDRPAILHLPAATVMYYHEYTVYFLRAIISQSTLHPYGT